MVDILVQVKIFQELNKTWRIGKRSDYIVSKIFSNEKIKNILPFVFNMIQYGKNMLCQ